MSGMVAFAKRLVLIATLEPAHMRICKSLPRCGMVGGTIRVPCPAVALSADARATVKITTARTVAQRWTEGMKMRELRICMEINGLAEDENGNLALMTPEKTMPSGAEIM